MNNVSNQNASYFSWMYRWFYSNKKLVLRRHFLLILLLGLLFIPYFIFTLPGSFLMGSFCNRQKKMKITLSIIGYFLMMVGVCMITPILNYWNLIPAKATFNVVIVIGKIWDVFAILGILLLLVSAISDSIGDIHSMLSFKKNISVSWILRKLNLSKYNY